LSEVRVLSEDEIARWYAGKTFATDWTSWHFPNWENWLAPFCVRPTSVLEIGSWEGRSALFFLNYMPRAHLVCVDTFAGAQEHQAADDAAVFLPTVEKTFDANTSAFADRVEKIKARSADALAQLGLAKRRFDLAYIDGSHRAADVYSDGVLAWPLVEPGGLVIFDDYELELTPDPLDNARLGIDSFLNTCKGQYRILHQGYQVAVVKLQRDRS
jgi:predicted O-methyltransferase YrrM